MSKSNNFESLRVVSITLDESNNSSTYADIDTPAQGLFIKPSPGVPNRDADITGYILSSTDNDGKVEWVAPDTGTLPAPLQSIASLTTVANQMLYTTASNTYDVTSISALGRSFVSLLTTESQRQQLGLEIGVDVQAYSTALTALNSISTTADRLAYTVGDSYSGTPLSTYVRTNILNVADSTALATELGYLVAFGDFSISTNAIPKIRSATELEASGVTIDASDNITTTGTINGVTPTEFSQLANIGAITISNTQWGYLGDLDQTLATTSTPTFTGLSAGAQKITSVLNPTNAQDAATKSYVDAAVSTGAPPLDKADYATAAVLPNTPVYASPAETLTSAGGPGTLSVDGQVVSVGDRILVKNQADPRENGVYDVTDDGATPGPNWVLTRSSDFNQAAMPLGAGTSIFISIVVGASNSASTWSLQADINDVDPLTDNVLWVQIGGSPTFTSGLGIDAVELAGGTIQVENTARFTYSGNALELATVTVPYGGTGNTTLTVNGVLVGDGANAVDTSKAAPTGDFLGTSDTQALTNKTITSNTNDVTARSLFSNNGANTVSAYAAANPSSGQVLTATSATTATWQTPASGGANYSRTLTVSPSNPDVTPDWTTLAQPLWMPIR